MGERSLAHIEVITAIDPIVGADKIEVASVLGWKIVVVKDKHKVGEKIVLCEVDSILPAIEFFNFMAERKYRVRSIKLRKQISQGLILSLEDISTIREQLGKPTYQTESLNISEDLTEDLGIVKYLSPSEREESSDYVDRKKHNFFVRFITRFEWYRKLFKKKSKSFPEWISVTDETRIQNFPEVLEDRSEDWYISEKLEGQSGTYWYKKNKFFGGEFGICSRTVRKFPMDNSNWSKVARIYAIKNNLKKVSKEYGDVCVQGEVVGPRIQENIYKLEELDFYVFNVYDIKNRKKYPLDKAQEITKKLGLRFVPVLEVFVKLPLTVDECLKKADGMSVLNEKTQREGIVFRKMDMSKSFKAVSNIFLLNKKDEE